MEKNRTRRTRLEIILALLCFGGLSAAGHYFFGSQGTETKISVSEPSAFVEPVVASDERSSPSDVVESAVAPVETVTAVKVVKVVRHRPSARDPAREEASPEPQPPVTPSQDSIVIATSRPPVAPSESTEVAAEDVKLAAPEFVSAVTTAVPPAVTPAAEARAETPPESQPLASATRKTLDPEFWIWAGVGQNYQYYKQSVPSNAGSADFQNIKGPTLYLSVGSQGENFGAEFVHKESPGKMSAPPGTTITNGDYTWKTLSAETFYKPDDSNWRWRLGFQSHSMPFMVYTPAANRLDIKTNLLILATVGFDRIYPISKKLRGEWQLRYQHPISTGASSGDKFEVSPVVAVDGSVGSIYQVTDQFRLGMFWYGQYHHYRFQYSGTSNFSGEQTLFYSNVELRAGFEF